jgi:hypothetical protein
MTRISLDLTAGTFTKVEEVCRDEFQNKAQYLRMLISKDLKYRSERGRRKRSLDGMAKKK